MGPVQKDLGLDSASLENVGMINGAFHAQLNAESADLRHVSPEERPAAREKNSEIQRRLNDTFIPRLKAALTPAQFERLQEIQWQLAEIQALTNTELAGRIDLTPDQHEKIMVITRAFHDKPSELAGRSGQEDPEEVRARQRELVKERDEKAGDVLTRDQREKSTKLKGRPFDVNQIMGRADRRGDGPIPGMSGK